MRRWGSIRAAEIAFEVPDVAKQALARGQHAGKSGLSGGIKMVEIAQTVLFVVAGTLLYGLVVFLFRDQIVSRPMKAQVAGGNIIDMAVRHSPSERSRQ